MIIFVGVAGSGKSVQGKMLAKELDCNFFSTGEFLRQHVNQQIQEKMKTGELVSDEEVIWAVSDALEKIDYNSKDFVLDGFPRTAKQAEWLIEKLKVHAINIKFVFHLKAESETITARLLERHRPDDHMAAIKQRLVEYRENILPIIEEFKKSGVAVVEINANQSAEDVHQDIMEQIRKVVK